MESISAPTVCANCGKGEEESGNLKKCSACQLVKYCSRECQAAHRPQHKKECKKRAAELYDEKLFKEVEPEECPICMLPISGGEMSENFQTCCGKTICIGCIYAMKMSEEATDLCPFCRTPDANNEDEDNERLKKIVESGNADAYYLLGCRYADGDQGLAQDRQKAHELFLKGGELGCPTGYYSLGLVYTHGDGVEVDVKKAKQYFELAAMRGSLEARYDLGVSEYEARNIQWAYKHWILAAKAGCERSLDLIKKGYELRLVTKDEYESTLRAYHDRQKEMKSDERERAADWFQSIVNN